MPVDIFHDVLWGPREPPAEKLAGALVPFLFTVPLLAPLVTSALLPTILLFSFFGHPPRGRLVDQTTWRAPLYVLEKLQAFPNPSEFRSTELPSFIGHRFPRYQSYHFHSA